MRNKKLVMNDAQLRRIIRESVKKTLKENSNVNEVNEVWGEIIGNEIATQSELELITDINGYSIETLNSVIYARTGYHDMEQYKGAVGN